MRILGEFAEMLHIDFLSPMKGLTSFLILGMKNGVEYDVYLIHG